MDLATLNAQAEVFATTYPTLFYSIVIISIVWKMIWYGLALFKVIEKKQKIWFVVLFTAAFTISDLGILPIIYLIFYREKKQKKKR